MLRNMGYAPGKGLGKNESGIVAPIQIAPIEERGIGLGYKTQDQKQPSLVIQLRSLVEEIEGMIKTKQMNLEQLKNGLFVATRSSDDQLGENLYQLCQEIHESALDQRLNFLDRFSIQQLETADEFVQAQFYEILSSADWDPVIDKDPLFSMQKYRVLRIVCIQTLIATKLARWIQSVKNDEIVWIPILLEWKPLLNSSVYNRYFYDRFILEKAQEHVQEYPFSIQSFIPLLMLDNESHYLESLLIDKIENCSLDDALLLKPFLTPTHFSQLAFKTISNLLRIACSFFETNESNPSKQLHIVPNEETMNRIFTECLKWHDSIGCSNMIDLLISNFLLPFQNSFSSLDPNQILSLYKSMRHALKECCLANQQLIKTLYRILVLINNL